MIRDSCPACSIRKVAVPALKTRHCSPITSVWLKGGRYPASGLGMVGAETVLGWLADGAAALWRDAAFGAGLDWDRPAHKKNNTNRNSPLCSRNNGYTSTIFRIKAP